jgi:tRNA uridine 5-carboxymethylaminomethyl modification enzyme
LGRETVQFSRTSSYIGVMIDDLVTRGVTEPYRMFTSRAEYRLSLRADNADQRLTPVGITHGIVSDRRAEAFEEKMDRLAQATESLTARNFTPQEVNAAGGSVREDGTRRTAYDLLSIPGITFDNIVALDPEFDGIDPDTRTQVAKDALYAKYIERQKREVEALKRDEGHAIPPSFDYAILDGLTSELKAKLSAARPETLAQAGRIEGMTPAALTLLLAKLRQMERAKTA